MATTMMVKSMEKGDSSGVMEVSSQAISTTITSKAKELMNGMTEEGMKVTGRTTRWTAREYSLGQTAESMRESIKRT
jgi:hypothetical protein